MTGSGSSTAIQDYLSGETSEFEVEHRVRRKDGSYRWMLTRGVAMRDPAGRPIRFIGSCIDITDHRHAEEALRESEERFRGTFENAAVGIAHKDADGRFLRVNEKYCEIVGYTRDELLQRTFQDITHPEDLAAELEQYTPLMRGELPSYSLEKRYIRKDGSLIWIDVIHLAPARRGGPARLRHRDPPGHLRTQTAGGGDCARPRRRPRRPTGPRTSSWPTSATRSARP